MLDTYSRYVDDTERLARLRILQEKMQSLWNLAEAKNMPFLWSRFEEMEVQERSLLRPGRML